MACSSAGRYDFETNRYNCQVTGDECMFMRPDSKACAEMYGEGPDADNSEGGDQIGLHETDD